MAKKKNNSSEKRKKTGFKTMLLLIIGSLAAIIFMQMTFVLLIVGLLPTIVVYFVDNSQSRSLFLTVMACNLSGVLPYVAQLIADGNETSQMQQMLGNMGVLLMMYASAALGWILMSVAPHIARFIIVGINSGNVQRLEQSQKRLINEWGEEISNTSLN